MHSRLRWVLVAALAAVAIAVGSLLGIQRAGVQGQVSTTLAVDVDTGGNFPASVGQIDDCAVLDMGQSETIDIVVLNVDDLLGFELTFRYDPSVVEIADTDLRQFLATASGSRVIDVSEPLPDPDQLHLFGAADIGSDARESGSGVLARVTLTAKGTGVSPLEIYEKDITGDGDLNFGARLIVSQGRYIGDENGDDYFDGTVLHANLAVETDCPSPPPDDGGTTPPSNGGGSSGGDGSSPEGDDTVLLLPDTPPEISDAIVLAVAAPGAEDEASGDGASESGGSSGDSDSNDSSDGDSAEGDGDSSDGGSTSTRAGDSSSDSGLPLWLLLAIPAAMLAFGGTVILLALRGARG